ncbi:MAG: putative lipid II flippase FtsW [Spirochaetota bacterium]
MTLGFTVEKIKRVQCDPVLLALLILLVGLGLAVLFSASYYYAGMKFDDPLSLLKRQAIIAAAGVVIAFIATRLPVTVIKKGIPAFLIISLIFMILTFLPGTSLKSMGAKRWVNLFGFSFQPSEVVKLSLILYLAYIFSKKDERLHDLINSIFPPLLVVLICTGLVYMQNDFSTAFFIFFLALAMFYIVKVRLIYFIFLLAAGIPLSVILLFTKEHRVKRLIAFIDPGVDPIGAGYQLKAARSALIRGGLWGTGLGEGTKKLGGIPEVHSDFVFAVLGEEMGFIGVLFILGIFIAFAVRGYTIALKCKDKFKYYLAFGITTSILYQAFLNIAVVSGIVPATGMPLPFFSAGGSSMITTLTMCGLLLNIARNNSVAEDQKA